VLSGHTAPITQLLFGPDGRTLVTASDDKTLRCGHSTGLSVNRADLVILVCPYRLGVTRRLTWYMDSSRRSSVVDEPHGLRAEYASAVTLEVHGAGTGDG